MTRRTRSRFPEFAKLASGVVIGGLGLGLLVSLTVDTEMKRPSATLPESVEPAAVPQLRTWSAYDFDQSARPESLPPDFDYDEVGAEWAIEAGEDPLIPPPADDASEAASAAEEAAREAAVAAESAVPSRRSDLVEGGLY